MIPELYQQSKILLVAVTGMPRETFHLLIGLVVHLAACLVRRQPVTWPGGIFAALLVGIGLEVPDLIGNYRSTGQLHWFESAKDLVHDALAPTLVVLAGLMTPRPGRRRAR